MAKRIGNNEHNVTWVYAKACWNALDPKNDPLLPLPPIPMYDIWETEENGGKGRVFIGKKMITPCTVTRNGVTVYGK